MEPRTQTKNPNCNWRSNLITASSLLNLTGSALLVALGSSDNDIVKSAALILSAFSIAENFLAVPFRRFVRTQSQLMARLITPTAEQKHLSINCEKEASPPQAVASDPATNTFKVKCQVFATFFCGMVGAAAGGGAGNPVHMLLGAAAGSSAANLSAQTYEGVKHCRN